MFSGLPRKRSSDLTRVYALVAAPPAEDDRRQNEKARLNASSRCRASQQEASGGSKPPRRQPLVISVMRAEVPAAGLLSVRLRWPSSDGDDRSDQHAQRDPLANAGQRAG